MKFIKYNKISLEILRSIYPFIPIIVLTDILEPETFRVSKNNKEALEKIWSIYNSSVNNIITEIIYYIREMAMKCKVALINEINSNIKLMIRRTEQTVSHRKEIKCLAIERIKL